MTNDMLSQEEIDALLKGGQSSNDQIEFYEEEIEDDLTEMETDALGEIGNITMGTAATTLSTLLNRKVNITTPTVTVTTSEELAQDYTLPFVAIDVSYKEGLEGSNILILDTDDTKIITDLMMGKDDFDLERDLTELDLSAVSEAMNQMMGSASTALSEMFLRRIDIEPPLAKEITFSEGKESIDILKNSTKIIKISFKMVVEDLIDSNIMQLVPIDFGKSVVAALMGSSYSEDINVELDPEPEINIPIEETKDINAVDHKDISINSIANNPPKQEEAAQNQYYYTEPVEKKQEENVVVKKPDFQAFDTISSSPQNSPINIVGDIPVEITVELGRTNRKISEILEFGQGTVIELDKLVGEPLSIYANGRFIAKGEVVVIDDNFGVRVVEIKDTNKKII